MSTERYLIWNKLKCEPVQELEGIYYNTILFDNYQDAQKHTNKLKNSSIFEVRPEHKSDWKGGFHGIR